MRRERFEKTARIPVRVRQGQVEFLYDEALPPLREGAQGELIVEAMDVLPDQEDKPQWRRFLLEEEKLEIAPAGSFIAVRVAEDKGAMELKDHLLQVEMAREKAGAPKEVPKNAPDPFWELRSGFSVLCRLNEPLYLLLRGEKSAQLRGGAPQIPCLQAMGQKWEASSLNQAQVWISQTFEPKRQGNTGDVFRDAFLLRPDGALLLDRQREELEHDFKVRRWKSVGLEPEKVRQRALGGLFAETPTRKSDGQ